MAAGDVITFQQFYHDLGKEIHDLALDDLRVAILDNSISLSAGLADPHFGGTGTTNLATAHVAQTGAYATGPIALTGQSWALASGEGRLTVSANPAWVNAASSPTNCYFLLLYNNTHASKPAISAYDLGGPVSLVASPITWTVSANGMVRIKLD